MPDSLSNKVRGPAELPCRRKLKASSCATKLGAPKRTDNSRKHACGIPKSTIFQMKGPRCSIVAMGMRATSCVKAVGQRSSCVHITTANEAKAFTVRQTIGRLGCFCRVVRAWAIKKQVQLTFHCYIRHQA